MAGYAPRDLHARYDVLANGCWLWNMAVHTDGYGVAYNNKRAHRFMYEELVGPIPKGLELHHTCGEPLCVNPDHLQPMTRAEHNALKRKEICIGGHPQFEGSRYANGCCKQCDRERER